MRLALSILFVLASLGVLIHAYFARIQPYDIMLQSIKLLPRLLMQKPLLVVAALIATVVVPFSAPLAGAVAGNAILQIVLAVLIQAAVTILMALIAVRVHRGIVKRDKSRWLQFGPVERRMVRIVLSIWALVFAISAIPPITVALNLPAIVVRLADVVSGPLSWFVVVFLALAGPAASFQDPHPFRRSVSSAKMQFTAVAAIVMLSRGLFSLLMIGVGTAIQLLNASPIVMALALPVVFVTVVGTFLVSEIAIAIALTRCWENIFDDDTRGRDYNIDWH